MYNNIGYFINQLPKVHKKTIRELEKTSKKLIDSEYAVVFNKCCISEKLLPKYSDIKTHDPAARYEKFTRQYREKLVEFQLEKSLQRAKDLREEVTNLRNQAASWQIDQNLHNNINEKLEEILEQYRHVTKSRILKKLNKIYGGQIKLPEEKNNRCYINLSHYQPTENE